MKIDIEEIKKLKIAPDEVLLIKVHYTIPMSGRQELGRLLSGLGIRHLIRDFDMEMTIVKDEAPDPKYQNPMEPV